MNSSLRLKTSQLAAILIAAPLFLSGCSTLLPGSKYIRPEVGLPDKWSVGIATGTSVATGEKWWHDFNDPTLNALIERALKSNNNLAAATIKVRRAQLNARLTGTNRTPSLSVGANSDRSRDLNSHIETKSNSVTGTVSYELDLWGKLASARDASRWEADATEADRRSTALALIGTVASDYWQIAYLNERISSVEDSISYAEKLLELVEIKYSAGAVSALDKFQAQQTLSTQRAELTQLLQSRNESRNAMAILFDQSPENWAPELKMLPYGQLPAVNAGVPATLLGQRPDLQAAEQRLRKYLANIDNTRAAFYPTFSLTGTLGSSSTSLSQLLQNPYTTLGAGLTLPFLQWNTMKLNADISKTDYEEAVVNFRQTLYSALSDVENALSARTNLAEEGKQREEALALAKKGEELAEVRYRYGSTALQSWLDAQESRRSAESALAAIRLSRLKNAMALYQAVGGTIDTPAK